jgi:hypothetical protein
VSITRLDDGGDGTLEGDVRRFHVTWIQEAQDKGPLLLLPLLGVRI